MKLFLVDTIYDFFDQKSTRLIKAVKTNMSLCDKQKAYFYHDPYEIDLPISRNEKTKKHEHRSLEFPFYYGNKKENGLKDYLGLKDDFALRLEKFIIKVPEQQRPRIYASIYADKDTPIDSLLPLYTFLQKENIRTYQVYRKNESVFDSLETALVRVDLDSVLLTTKTNDHLPKD